NRGTLWQQQGSPAEASGEPGCTERGARLHREGRPAAVRGPLLKLEGSAVGSTWLRLGEPPVVAERVPEGGVDTVEAFLRFLNELHALRRELPVGGPTVLGPKRTRPQEAGRHQRPDLLGDLALHHRWAGQHQHQRHLWLGRRVDDEKMEAVAD